MSSRLILVPTELERRVIAPLIHGRLAAGDRLELCGFGPVVAAARAARLLADLRPAEVVLAGIAGTIDRHGGQVVPGTAWLFERVAAYGIGAGTGQAFTPAADLGWPQWPGDPSDAGSAIGDAIDCPLPPSCHPLPRAGLLLTACSAAAGAADVELRKRLHPDATAEDMEGFGVAAACRLAGVPCRLLRGISNVAGDRDKDHWQVAAALEGVAHLLIRLLATTP